MQGRLFGLPAFLGSSGSGQITHVLHNELKQIGEGFAKETLGSGGAIVPFQVKVMEDGQQLQGLFCKAPIGMMECR